MRSLVRGVFILFHVPRYFSLYEFKINHKCLFRHGPSKRRYRCVRAHHGIDQSSDNLVLTWSNADPETRVLKPLMARTFPATRLCRLYNI